VLACLGAGLLCGCLQYTQPVVEPVEPTPRQKNFQAVWDASIDTLNQFYFTVDRQDRRAGVIATLPIASQQWFEFWRRDAVLGRQLFEDSIQTLYRSARVVIRPARPGSDEYTASARVEVYRSDGVSPQVTSTSEAYDLFLLTGDEMFTRTLLLHAQPGGPGKMTPLGRDRLLERRIEAYILLAMKKAEGPKP